jgi:hypothetical protein
VDFVTGELANLSACGAIVEVKAKPRCVLLLGVEPLKPRLILVARFVNLWCEPPDMSYDTSREFQRGIEANDFLFSMDFKSGYHHIKFKKSSRKFFGFSWQGKYYVSMWSLLAGTYSPYVFNMLSLVVVAFLRERGLHSLENLDDSAFALPDSWSEEQRKVAVWKVVALLYMSGYTLSLKKSNLTPSRIITLLGFCLDTVRGRFFVPDGKLQAFLSLVSTVKEKDRLSVRSLQSLGGKAESMALAAPPIRIFLRSAYEAIGEALRGGANTVVLPPLVASDLGVLRALAGWAQFSTWHSEAHVTYRMETYASMAGWSGTLTFNGEYREVGDPFPSEEGHLPIHVKELLAVKYTLDALGRYVRDCFLDLYTDNVIDTIHDP